MSKEITIYDYMRDWFDFCFENTEMIKPNHSALYFFILSHSNRMGWKPKFGLPTTMAKEAIGIRSYNTYIETLLDLIDFGFIKLLEKSKNQYSSNIIALSKYNKATIKALDKATIKHVTKQSESMVQSIDSIIIQSTNTQITNTQDREVSFNLFWDVYGKKVDNKKCKEKFIKLSESDIDKIMVVVYEYVKSTPDIKYRKNPLTWLNGQCWNDQITVTKVIPIKREGNTQSGITV